LLVKLKQERYGTVRWVGTGGSGDAAAVAHGGEAAEVVEGEIRRIRADARRRSGGGCPRRLPLLHRQPSHGDDTVGWRLPARFR